MKTGFWKRDWVFGLVVVVLTLFAGSSELLQSLARSAYEMRVQASSRTPSDRIAVIASDNTSIANVGRWPWSRGVHAKMIDLLAGARAEVIGYSAFFGEPKIHPGYRYVTTLLEMAQEAPPPVSPGNDTLAPFVALPKQAEQDLNTDGKSAASAARAAASCSRSPRTSISRGAADCSSRASRWRS